MLAAAQGKGVLMPDDSMTIDSEVGSLMALPPSPSDIVAFTETSPGGRLDGYISFAPISRVYLLGNSSFNVQTGTLVYAPHKMSPIDRDEFAEEYLEGETVARDQFRRNDEVWVAEFAEYPGRLAVKVKQELAGISTLSSETADVRFRFFFRMEDPRKYISHEQTWKELEGQERLRQTIIGVIRDTVKSTIDPEESIHLWSAPRVGEVAGSLFARLNEKLEEWGLRVRKAFTVERKYPQRLTDLALEFRLAEQEFTDSGRAKKSATRDKLGLLPSEPSEMDSISEKGGMGSGLLTIAKRHKHQIDPIVRWLREKEGSAFTAADFLEETYVPRVDEDGKTRLKYTPQQVELSIQVLLAAIRYPILGMGEWGDTEQNLAEISDYHLLESYLQTKESGTSA